MSAFLIPASRIPLCPGLAAAVILAVAAPPVAAELRPVDLWSGYELDAYGQFHFAYQGFDDGQTVTENLVDITNANSRLGFHVRPSGDDSGLIFHFESGLGFRPSQKTSQTNTPAFWDWSRTDLRKVQFIYGGTFGEVKLGQGSMPTDGAAEADLGGTVVVAKSTIPEGNGAYILRSTAGALTGITIGDTFDNFDGDRRLRLRYDTPSVAGFSLGAAYGREVLKSGDDNRYFGFALRYAGEFDGVEVKGALGSTYVRKPSGGGTTRTTIGSVSVLHQATGLNLSVAAGQYLTGPEPYYVYLKAGWNARLVSPGDTKFVAEFFRGRDYVTAGARSRMWSVGVIQEFEKQQVETYAGYRSFGYDDATPVSYLDSGALQIGARWRF